MNLPSVTYAIKIRFMQVEWTPFRGGETEALKRLEESLSNKVQLHPQNS